MSDYEYVYEMTFAHGGKERFSYDFSGLHEDTRDSARYRMLYLIDSRALPLVTLDGNAMASYGAGCMIRELGLRREVKR